MIVAAEASSAYYALKLMKYWKEQGLDLDISGVGSQAMEDFGMRRFGKSEDMAVVGVAEVIAHYSELKAVFHKLVEEAIRIKPKFLLLMDYPDFNLKLAKTLKQKLGPHGIKVFYYISPQVWAWRKGRIFDIKKHCDKVFLLFPFEKKFYDQHNVPYEFVGHPLLEDLDPKLLDLKQQELARQKYGVGPNERILALMPGSRKSEIQLNFGVQLEVARALAKKYDFLRIMIFVAPTLSKEYISDFVVEKLDYKMPYMLIQDDPNKMISLAHYVLATSGTATLMVGLLQKPMVIMYRLKWISGVIGRILVRGIKYFGLVNLIMNEEVVPERLQSAADSDKLIPLLEKFIEDEAYAQATIKKLAQLQYQLGDVGATARVGEALAKHL
ncbi:lipid-A-disaccharide synthase [Bdellovibrio sp. qaytius]|nr:lipid-A-disaccharide synthase [Bdellovibrio sp. qaytius]